MERNFCHKCGKKIESDVNFCPYCGAEISKAKKIEANTSKKNKVNSNVIVIASLVIAIVIVVLVLNNNKQLRDEKLQSKNVPSAQQQEQMNKTMEGILATKKALEENPMNYELNVRMGNNNYDIGRFEEAIKYYRIARNINNDDPSVVIDMGVAFFNLSRMDSALYYMKQALKIDPDNPQGLFNSGVVYMSIGDSSEAVNYWERLIEVQGNSNQAQRAKQLVENIKKK